MSFRLYGLEFDVQVGLVWTAFGTKRTFAITETGFRISSICPALAAWKVDFATYYDSDGASELIECY